MKLYRDKIILNVKSFNKIKSFYNISFFKENKEFESKIYKKLELIVKIDILKGVNKWAIIKFFKEMLELY